MAPIKVTNDGVLKLLQSLDIKKATGPDSLPARILREFATEIAPILTVIFQQSLDTGIVPADWRLAIFSQSIRKGTGASRPTIVLCQLPLFVANCLNILFLATSWLISTTIVYSSTLSMAFVQDGPAKMNSINPNSRRSDQVHRQQRTSRCDRARLFQSI